MTPKRVRALSLTSYIGMLVLTILWYFVIEPPRYGFSTVLSLLYCGILLLPAYGLFRNRQYTYLWSSYLILLYFMHGIVESYANTAHRALAIAEVILSFTFFISASLNARYLKRQLR